MNAFLWFLLAWLAGARLVGMIFFYEVSWGRQWPEGSHSDWDWAKLALLCPEWTWYKFWREYPHSRPAPVSKYSCS